MKETDRLTFSGVIANAILFVLKAYASILSGSLAVISDTLNSLLDIVSYTLIYLSVKASRKEADGEHPFGHHRVEPLAALVIAIFAGILGFEVIKTGVLGFFNGGKIAYSITPVAVLSITIATKILMSHYYLKVGKRVNSPALVAGSVDSRNDVLVSGIALLGYAGSSYLSPALDDIAAILIGGWILKSGYDIGAKNVDYLMGKAPEKPVYDEIRARAESVAGVRGLNTVRAHYVGNYVQVEVHINVDKKLATEDSHAIAKKVQHLIEQMPCITDAFIHVDPT